jgi:hypothetical protein
MQKYILKHTQTDREAYREKKKVSENRGFSKISDSRHAFDPMLRSSYSAAASYLGFGTPCGVLRVQCRDCLVLSALHPFQTALIRKHTGYRYHEIDIS